MLADTEFTNTKSRRGKTKKDKKTSFFIMSLNTALNSVNFEHSLQNIIRTIVC